jgi:CIC family chloride channel protein
MKGIKLNSIGKRILDRIQNSQNAAPTILAVIVGLLAGFGAIAFRYLIRSAHWLFFDYGGTLSAKLAFLHVEEWYIMLLPAVGMLFVSLIVRRWAMEARGHGVPEVQYAVKMKGGRIRLRVAFVKVIASALCIGSGGSVGREGPIVQIGSSLASAVGRLVRLRESDVKLLVAGGAAGAIGGTFNAPIAGVMFALEVILGSFSARSFGLLVISSVTSVALCQAFLGKQPAFELVQTFALNNMWELPLYLVLGLFVGMISLVYVASVYYFEDLFRRWHYNAHIKAFVGGLAIGALGFFGSQYIFGVGYEGVEMALQSNFSIKLLLILLVLKILATSITLGAGGSGGVFAPALFIGAMGGGAFGLIANQLFPSVTPHAGAYALVGMAAMFGGAARAPITSIIIIFEMTDDYKIILPLMLAVVVSYLVASRFGHDSIYSKKLRQLGGMAAPWRDFSILDMILVSDAMDTDYQTVSPELSVTEFSKLLRKNLIRSCPVIDSDNRLVGIVTEFDVEKSVVEGKVEGFAVSDIMTTGLITCTPDESLRTLLSRFKEQDIHQIPVVDKEDPKKILGVLRRSEILWAYNELADEYKRLSHRMDIDFSVDYSDCVQAEIQVRSEQSRISFKKIRDMHLPGQCLIGMLRRGDHVIIPRGDTVIEPGDVLVLLTTRAKEKELRSWMAKLENEVPGEHDEKFRK